MGCFTLNTQFFVLQLADFTVRATNAKILKEIWEFAEPQAVSKSGQYLADLLQMSVAVKDLKSSVELLKKMAKTPWETHNATEQRTKAVLEAVRVLKWDAVKDAVRDVVTQGLISIEYLLARFSAWKTA